MTSFEYWSIIIFLVLILFKDNEVSRSVSEDDYNITE